MAPGMEVGLIPGDFVLDGTQPPLQKGGGAPQFSAYVYCLLMHASRCHLLWRWASAQATLCSMGTQLPSEKRVHPPHPIFGPCLLWPNGWMDEDATWYGSRPRPRRHCVRRGPSSPRKGHNILWPRSPISATAELLYVEPGNSCQQIEM